MVVSLAGQEAPPIKGNFTAAAQAEVRDAQGQAVLQGPFVQVDEEEDDEIERKAILKPTGTDPDAAGDAEVEFAKAAPTSQEIEFSVRGLEPGATFTFVIDGQIVATATADKRGQAEVELDVKFSEPSAAR
ncbi:MAG TPA: hypothetical protein VF424_17030 [Vicinamibacterales bacterium]